MIKPATRVATTVVPFWLMSTPMILFWLVKRTRGITAKGSPKLRITWLKIKYLGRVQSHENDDQGRHQGDHPADPDRDLALQEPLHDHLTGHGANR